MENLVSPASWKNKRVLITGHTGFKGSWLALWLHQLGAQVTGLSLPAEKVCLFRQARIEELVDHREGDIRDLAVVERCIEETNPHVVFHMAAQPLVRESYNTPVETFATNVQGTVHLLDACRRAQDLQAIICVTSDKCYENREWIWPYRENDPMGGHDPYSASKGAAELVIASYRQSFFEDGIGLASVRAGNVIGGGDWATDRLIPDMVRAILSNQLVEIRSPNSVRPWQHVFEALGGYLMLAARLMEGRKWASSAWNFGPAVSDARQVGWIVERIFAEWGTGKFKLAGEHNGVRNCPSADSLTLHEAKMLRLDCSKAATLLGWTPSWDLETALTHIVDWYRRVGGEEDAREVSVRQLEAYRAQLGETLLRKNIQ